MTLSLELITSRFLKKKRFYAFAQVFITISKYSVRFDFGRLFHNVMTSCMFMTSCNDIIHE